MFLFSLKHTNVFTLSGVRWDLSLKLVRQISKILFYKKLKWQKYSNEIEKNYKH